MSDIKASNVDRIVDELQRLLKETIDPIDRLKIRQKIIDSES